MKILEEKSTDIHVSEMKDGEIGIITDWTLVTHIGKVIQRHKDILIELGSPTCWSGISKDPSCRVRILPKGTKLEI